MREVRKNYDWRSINIEREVVLDVSSALVLLHSRVDGTHTHTHTQ
jgi:hypothetical protein